MPTINFILADGAEHAINGEVGTPVMYFAKRNKLSSILTEYDSQCRCATCHVYIDPQWISKLPKMADDDRETLEFVDGVDDMSRLICQLKITDEMDGLIMHVPESQYCAAAEPESGR